MRTIRIIAHPESDVNWQLFGRNIDSYKSHERKKRGQKIQRQRWFENLIEQFEFERRAYTFVLACEPTMFSADCPLLKDADGRKGSISVVQLRYGNDQLSANCRQWIVQRLVQTATSELTRNDEFDAVTVIMVSTNDGLVAEQSALEQ